jgi:hypothetical protein
MGPFFFMIFFTLRNAELRSGWSGVLVPARDGNFSIRHRVLTGSGTRAASCPMGAGGPFPGGGAVGTRSRPLTSIQCRGQGAREVVPPLLQCAFVVSCSKKELEQLYLIYPASYPIGTRGPFPGVKRPGREADHSPPSSVEVKNVWSYTSTPPIFLHGVVLS